MGFMTLKHQRNACLCESCDGNVSMQEMNSRDLHRWSKKRKLFSSVTKKTDLNRLILPLKGPSNADSFLYILLFLKTTST